MGKGARILFAVCLVFVAMLPMSMGSASAGTIESEDASLERDGVRYEISVKDIGGQRAEVIARFPVNEASTILYMPVWTPGYYVKEDYKAGVVEIHASDANGNGLAMQDPGGNRWVVDTSGAEWLVVRYVLSAKGRSVSLNEISRNYAVFNGSATYIAAKGQEARRHVVTLSLPAGWKSASGLEVVNSNGIDAYMASSYEDLIDSPIMVGDLEIAEFDSMGTAHAVAYNRGAAEVDVAKIAADLKVMTDETRTFWAEKPWPKYVFLIAFRDAGGGLEHKYSTFVNVSPGRFAAPTGYGTFMSLLAHEYQHAFNVKRLRPFELGPFDYESTPMVSTLWISEGLTSYYSNLMLKRSGLVDADAYLAGLSRQITALQNSPGRLRQSLEQSSLGVWSNSLSGVGASSETVSYYVKGEVVGFLLDAHIRRLTGGGKSLDDVMKAAYERYSGDAGFHPDEFYAVAEAVIGQPLGDWFSVVIGSASELDYSEALEWFGLALERTASSDGMEKWTLSVAEGVDPAQASQLHDWLH